MNFHQAEVISEAWLKEGAGGGVQGLTGRAQHFVHDRRRRDVRRWSSPRPTLQQSCFALLFAGFTCAPRSAARTLSLEARRLTGSRTQLRRKIGAGHAHDLIGHAVSFLLVLVAGSVNGQLRLDCRRGTRQHAQDCMVADGSLQSGEVNAKLGSI
jgi:hypothetical protein